MVKGTLYIFFFSVSLTWIYIHWEVNDQNACRIEFNIGLPWRHDIHNHIFKAKIHVHIYINEWAHFQYFYCSRLLAELLLKSWLEKYISTFAFITFLPFQLNIDVCNPSYLENLCNYKNLWNLLLLYIQEYILILTSRKCIKTKCPWRTKLLLVLLIATFRLAVG